MSDHRATWRTQQVDVRAVPKVLLHDHLDGGLRPSTILELAEQEGIDLPESNQAALTRWFHDHADSGSLERYLETFAVTLRVMQTPEALYRIAREAVEDLAADGVLYAELRWAPEQHLRRGASFDTVITAVAEGLREGCERHGIRAGQLICAMRQNTDSVTVADAALRNRGDGELGGVWGFDLAGPEEGFPPSEHREALDRLAAEFLPVTIHAGEAVGIESIASALLDGRALRLGHGARILDDITLQHDDDGESIAILGPVARWVHERQIALELAPSSNLQTGLVSEIVKHPFGPLYEFGFAATVNTDNRLMSATSASRELSRVADAFALQRDDLETLQLNAARAAFCPVAVRDELMEAILDGFTPGSPR